MALLNMTMMNIFTLPLSIAFPAPTHDGSTVLSERRCGKRLGEHVSRLVMGVYSMKGDFTAVDIVPEMVELDVDVFGPRAHLGDFGDFEHSAVVLKDAAMDGRLGGDHVKTLAFELLDQLHDWDSCAECS